MPARQSNNVPQSWLAVARRARRLSQRQLSALCGLSQPAISHIEVGGTKPRTVTKQALASALDYTVAELFPPPGRPSPSAELRDWARALNGKGLS